MAISKTTKGLFVSVLVLAIAVGIAHIAEAKVTVGKVQKVIQGQQPVYSCQATLVRAGRQGRADQVRVGSPGRPDARREH